MRWRDRWLRNPHPALVAGIAVASLLLLGVGTRDTTTDADTGIGGVLVRGTVERIASVEDAPIYGGARTSLVQRLIVRLDDGRSVQVVNDLTPLKAGDGLYLNHLAAGTAQETYEIMDYRRAGGLGWLTALFVAVVLAVSGVRKGFYALVGTLFSVAVIFAYLIPAIIGGTNPLVAGLIAACTILLGTFYVSYGFNRKSLAALAGIAVTLGVVALLAWWTVGEFRFTGYGDEAAIYLRAETKGSVSLVGLIAAGILVAALGVLDDVAITQASAVFELARAGVRGLGLFRQAMRVGTDHISAVINTLVLAYAGAALPLVMLLHLSRFPLAFTLGGEQVAEEIVRTLVSSLGLVLAVPLTTAVAVGFVERWGVPVGAGEHPHRH